MPTQPAEPQNIEQGMLNAEGASEDSLSTSTFAVPCSAVLRFDPDFITTAVMLTCPSLHPFLHFFPRG